MTDKLKTLIMMAVEREGTYDPDDALPAVEEKMNDKEFTLASTFLRWCVLHGKKFGTATFDTVFKEFKKYGSKDIVWHAGWTPKDQKAFTKMWAANGRPE